MVELSEVGPQVLLNSPYSLMERSPVQAFTLEPWSHSFEFVMSLATGFFVTLLVFYATGDFPSICFKCTCVLEWQYYKMGTLSII